MYGGGVYHVGGWGEGLGRAPNIRHKRLTPDPLARGQLVAVCGGGKGEGGLGRAPCVCINRVILTYDDLH